MGGANLKALSYWLYESRSVCKTCSIHITCCVDQSIKTTAVGQWLPCDYLLATWSSSQHALHVIIPDCILVSIKYWSWQYISSVYCVWTKYRNTYLLHRFIYTDYLCAYLIQLDMLRSQVMCQPKFFVAYGVAALWDTYYCYKIRGEVLWRSTRFICHCVV